MNKIDKQRIVSKFEEMDRYLEELEQIKPENFEEYQSSVEKKRACERLLQISIESILDVCNLLVSNLKVGIPSDEEDIFAKLENRKIVTKEIKNILINMKGFRNILVHRYGEISDELVFEILSERLEDLEKFKGEILSFIKSL